MSIQYPLTLPVAAKRKNYTLGYKTNIQMYASPDTFQQSIYEKAGKMWNLKLDIIPQTIDEQRLMSAFMTQLNGPYGTFKFYPVQPTLGKPTNKTITAHSTLRNTITLNDVTGINVGDFGRVGQQLIKIDDISGNVITIFPYLRADSIGSIVYFNDVYGVFRLKSNDQEWTMDADWMTTFAIEAVEAL